MQWWSGQAVAVNAHRKLARTAARRGWRTQGRSSTPTQTIRAKGLIYLLTRGNSKFLIDYGLSHDSSPLSRRAGLGCPRGWPANRLGRSPRWSVAGPSPELLVEAPEYVR